MSKILVMLSNEIKYKENIIELFSNYNNHKIEFKEHESNDLVQCALDFSETMKQKNYDKGIVIWITGVAFANIVSKKLQNKSVIFVNSEIYLEKILNDRDLDIVVLGEMSVGFKNIPFILEEFFKKL